MKMKIVNNMRMNGCFVFFVVRESTLPSIHHQYKNEREERDDGPLCDQSPSQVTEGHMEYKEKVVSVLMYFLYI